MSASASSIPVPGAMPEPGPAGGSRFGMSTASDGSVMWVLRRNCSITPGQSLAAYGGLCVLLMGVAVFFWAQGAQLVMPFAWVEILAVGAALWAYSRHAADREIIAVRDGRLVVEQHINGGCVCRTEFALASVRVQPHPGGLRLIGISGGGKAVEVGRHVPPEMRPLLADELRSVLRAGQMSLPARQSDLNLKL